MALDTSIPFRALQGMYNPADTVQQAASLKDLVQQQQLRGLQIQDAMDARQRQGTLSSLLPQVFGDTGATTGANAGAAPKAGRVNLNLGALKQLYALDPAMGKQMYELYTSIDDRQRSQVAERADAVGQAALFVQNLPEDQRAQAWDNAIEGLVGRGYEDLASYVGQYSPDTLTRAISSSSAVKGFFERQDEAFKRETETKRVNISQGQLEVAQGNLAQRREEARKAGQPNTAQARRDEVSLRKEFHAHPEVKAFSDVRQSYRTIEAIAQNPSAANDLALIFSYMKMLDPGSVVREGEFANAQNAAGVPDRVRNSYNRAMRGERLNPQQREQFLSSAGDVYRSRLGRYNELTEQYRGYASDYGADPNRVAALEAQEKASDGMAGSDGWSNARVVDN